MDKLNASLIIKNELITTDRSIDVIGPATGKPIGTMSCADINHVNNAVASATHAFNEWKELTAYERESIIKKATSYARTKADGIGMLMALEQGKPLKQSVGEVTGACDMIDYYAAEGVRIEGTINQTEKTQFRSMVIHQPVGVVAAITPWNYPVALLSWKLGPALAAGCSVIVKPTPITPLSPFAFCKALCDGGLPTALLSVICSDQVSVAEHLVAHPDVKKVAMTGATQTGKAINTAVADQLKSVTLELGGHCPAIVCEDADIEVSAKLIAYKAFRNMGQSCSTINRIYVHSSIHDALVDALTKEAEATTMGDGIEPGDVDLGPMCTAEAREKVEAHVKDAIDKGATLIYGGSRPETLSADGYYYLPTILTNVPDDAIMMHDETFGPVAPFQTYDDIDDAIARANDSRYGLSSYLFTKDMATMYKVSEALEAGTVAVNNVSVNSAYAPYEGWKDSGLGFDLSRDAIHEYLKMKHIKIAL
ncbi:MAG: NAD-dependent succinate-semialdehyde dehydrogenase [Lentisphaeria bacterium]|nr:NAD-dependent succinate-semialdehyde dehydrogenase [Lentisphaeria bacterium]NQZ68616.1 NAD-dependent succinate-semialdehyde dehydrogenase [Lentisphaeria bacterium]